MAKIPLWQIVAGYPKNASDVWIRRNSARSAIVVALAETGHDVLIRHHGPDVTAMTKWIRTRGHNGVIFHTVVSVSESN
jgi:hypothetical protein